MDDFLAIKSALRRAPSAVKKQHVHGINGLDTILHLGNVLHDKLQVKDESSETSDSPSDEDGSSGLDDENACNHGQNMDGLPAMASKCLQKCTTFLVSACSEGNEAEPRLEDCKNCSHSSSSPFARKLVSAIKGSREKEQGAQKKLSVSWAPDVYDPPPTSVTHFPKKKNQQHYSKSHKKHGKSKYKGKSTRGGGSVPKEKKHYRKSSGRSGRRLDSHVDTDRVYSYNSSLEILDFNDPGIGSPDPNCGSKFLGQASGTMHCVY